MFSAATKTGSQPSAAANYIEDVFSTYLYTGNSSTQTITNGIDLAGKGGLVWVKQRGPAGNNHQLADTVRGASSQLASNTTAAATSETNRFTSFNSNGFSLDSSTIVNNSTQTYCSWTFREQAKFFDIVTFIGNGTAGRTISHNLGSVPGMIIVKSTTDPNPWYTYHRSVPTQYGMVQSTAAFTSTSAEYIFGNNTITIAPTSTVFTVGADSTMNASGQTYVAYVFAHDAGGFGTAGTDNVISCGSFTTDGSGNATVNLGYEPQYVLTKSTAATAQGWVIGDVMRGMFQGDMEYLLANSSAAAALFGVPFTVPTATGFNQFNYSASTTYIYMAIRRPMKPPTVGTQVFKPFLQNDSVVATTDFPVDMFTDKDTGGGSTYNGARLVGGAYLLMNSTAAEAAYSPVATGFQNNTGVTPNLAANPAMSIYAFRRASGFMDVVCYSGNSTAGATQAHNLGVVPELMIIKMRSGADNWVVYAAPVWTGSSGFDLLFLNTDAGKGVNNNHLNGTQPTSTVFSLGTRTPVNASGSTYVAYLFATLAGVSKVGSYTGNGGTQAIACGFTAGARFVLIKRTDATGDWYVYDTARGMTLLTDPYLRLNSTAAETATLGSVTTTAGGFTVDATILAAINTNAASYIFLAIA